MLPLQGVKVLEIGQLIAVPSAGQQLAELGAEVTKLEPPQGEPARTMGAAYGDAILQAYNRGKRSIVIDLKDEQGRLATKNILRETDVVLHNLRPGTLDRLGFSFAEMKKLNPLIISVSVSGFGPHGPSKTRAGLDIAAQAESGLMSVTGERDGQPQRVGTPIVDHATSFVVTQAVLAAYIRKERYGEGAEIRVPLLEVAMHLQSPNWVEQQVSGTMMTRHGNGQPSVAPAADVIETNDGKIVVSGYQPEAWAALCDCIDRQELVSDPRFITNELRVKNRPALLEALTEGLSVMSAREAVEALSGRGVVAALVRTYDEVLEAPDVVENGVFQTAIDDKGQEYVVVKPPFHASPPLTRHLTAVPEKGVNTLHMLNTSEKR